MLKKIKKLTITILAMVLGMGTLIQSASAFIPDIPQFQAPHIAIVTPVPVSTTDTTPNFTFSTDQPGGIIYDGDCTSKTNYIGTAELTVTFEPLSSGVHSNCRLKVRGMMGTDSDWLIIPSFTIQGSVIIIPDFPEIKDLWAPTLKVVTPVATPTNVTTPSFTFNSNEAGAITYIGDCSSPAKPNAVSGNNTVTFSTLGLGTHSNCKLNVTDSSGNKSADLIIPSFTIQAIVLDPPLLDLVPPSLYTVNTVPTPTSNTTPSFSFNTNEAGVISYSGDCSSSTTNAVVGNNTVTFNPLSYATHSNCYLNVTDSKGNKSANLYVNSFVVQYPTSMCSGFTDINSSDPDCAAFTYVKSIGAMTGNPDGSFQPGSSLQRDQIAKIALESFGKFSKTADYCGFSKPFIDVDKFAWSFQYICRAKNLGVVTGYLSGSDAGYFRPSRYVNHAEFLALLLRNVPESMPTGTSYNDVDSSAWFAGYARYSKLNNLFSGSLLHPTYDTTRREVAQVLYKLHNLGKI